MRATVASFNTYRVFVCILQQMKALGKPVKRRHQLVTSVSLEQSAMKTQRMSGNIFCSYPLIFFSVHISYDK